ncbi:cysteine-rich receptor-like protein kinase 29 [Prosopis cineraria]|uniref:cysteine-rich receptor-like protein kinase 29 n=1 Tax=Prosopis cineraria TaxID=364024 RepID=UPI00240ED1DD|nr:cysteine-rich receptor-like protein kinase 29 [Prosopis cineraria]
MYGIYQYPDFYNAFGNPEEVAADQNKYKNALDRLMLNLKSIAGDSHRKLAVGNATIDKSRTVVYGLAQCMLDLSKEDCDACLLKAVSDISVCCQDKVGGRVIKFSCNIRFDHSFSMILQLLIHQYNYHCPPMLFLLYLPMQLPHKEKEEALAYH